MNKIILLLKSKNIKTIEYILNIIFLIYVIKNWVTNTENYTYNVIMSFICLLSFILIYKKEKIENYIKLKITNYLIKRK